MKNELSGQLQIFSLVNKTKDSDTWCLAAILLKIEDSISVVLVAIYDFVYVTFDFFQR